MIRVRRTLPIVLLTVLALPAGRAAAATHGSPPSPRPALSIATLGPSDLHAGQKATVKTVFQGDSIESFDAEIVGVLVGGRAEGDMILARATSERVKQMGVAQGMSGSPVYVDGKLVGALSSGWSFSKEPLFGITPIREMLGVLDMPSASDHASPGTAGPSGLEASTLTRLSAETSSFRELRWDDGDDVAELTSSARKPAALAAPSALMLPLACGGLNRGAVEPIARALAPLGLTVVPGGRAADGGPSPASLQPGAAVAVDVLRGDVQMSAIGTVTYRDGDRVLLFGHPFFQSGDVRLPLSTAEITTVVANQASSFKLGVRGRDAGVVTQDRRAAVAGHLGGSPKLLPLAVTIGNGSAAPQRFHFESIEDRSLAPSLVAAAAINSLLESGGTAANQTLRWTLTVRRHDGSALVLRDVIAGESPATDLMAAVESPLRFLMNNPYGRLALDSVNLAVDVDRAREQWTVRNARVLQPSVRPGGRLRVQCEIERWRGGREWREVTLTVPEEAPDGSILLWVGGGPELARYEAKELPARYRPTSLDDAWRRLSASRTSDGLYAALFIKSPEITSDGRDYPEMPLSGLSILSSGQVAGDRSRRGDVAKLDEQVLKLDGLTRGELQLQVRVDSRAP